MKIWENKRGKRKKGGSKLQLLGAILVTKGEQLTDDIKQGQQEKSREKKTNQTGIVSPQELR